MKKFTLSEHEILVSLLMDKINQEISEDEATVLWEIIDKVRCNTGKK